MPRTSEILDLAALDQLEALERAATPGPWSVQMERSHLWRHYPTAKIEGPDGGYIIEPVYNYGDDGCDLAAQDEDVSLIVALRNHAPALLALARAGLATKSDLLSALARERRRRAALEEVLRQIRRMAAFGEEGYDTPETLSRIVALTDTHSS